MTGCPARENMLLQEGGEDILMKDYEGTWILKKCAWINHLHEILQYSKNKEGCKIKGQTSYFLSDTILRKVTIFVKNLML